MEQIVSKKELEELMKIKGEVRGFSLWEDGEFILRKEGENGVKKLENALAETGHPLRFNEIKKMDFYPLWYQALILLLIHRIFNYGDKEFQEMGAKEGKVSPLIRLFISYIFSPERSLKMAAKMWRNAFSVGDLKVAEFNKKDRYIVLRLENWKLSPFNCQVLKGYFSSLLKLMVKKDVTAEETKCVFKGDEHHEFILRW